MVFCFFSDSNYKLKKQLDTYGFKTAREIIHPV